eukprot:TRINITY_DN3807_c0_g1_i8.p1 TRINITY_DN3807_c0_g1~~TRINITY_DN3807_c0_g1_i8.p1  ORF type:complete len:218 (+),score=33.73 TRINITY_DN3807_c0_g1_i8:149-802(+)
MCIRDRRERIVFDRETRAGDYGAMTYQLAQWIFETPVEMLGSMVGSILLFYIVGFEGNAGVFIAVNYLCYFACYGAGSALAILPFTIPVNCSLAALWTIAGMLGSDLIVTPYQIGRTYFIHALEVLSPVRQSIAIELDYEAGASTSAPPSLLLSSLGLNRTLNTPEVAWGLLVMNIVVYRILALCLIWLSVRYKKSLVNRMHKPTQSSTAIHEKTAS